jgi:thiol-disulfide isomerase/thioredoxin
MRKWLCIVSASWIVALALAVLSSADQPAVHKPSASQPAHPSPPAPTTSAPAAQPKLVIDEPTHDLGEVWAGKPVEYSFKFVNDGKAPLEIIRVQPTCGCTVAGPYPNRIQPGQSGLFPFRLDTKKLHGKFQKTVNITTNDATQPTPRLTLTGFCKRVVEVSPNDAVFGRLLEPKHQERVLTITTTKQDKSFIATLVTPPPNSTFHYMLLESIPGREYKLFVSIDPPFRTGTLNETVTINTNIDDVPTVVVTARAIVPARIEVIPPVIYVSKPTPGSTATPPAPRKITITNNGQAPFKVLSATSDDPAVKLTTVEVQPGKQFRVDVTVPPGYRPPESGRTILIKTDDHEFPEMKVAVKGPVDTSMARTPTSGPTSRPARPALALLGQTAPDFALKTIDGENVGKTEYKAYPATVLDFVAPNCGFCKRQLPLVEPIRASYESRGVRFVNVMQTMHQDFTQDQIIGVLNGLGNKAQVAIDTGNTVGQKFKATSYPTLFVVDKNGKIVEVVVGARSDIANTLTQRLDAMLKAESAGPGAASRPAEKSVSRTIPHAGS